MQAKSCFRRLRVNAQANMLFYRVWAGLELHLSPNTPSINCLLSESYASPAGLHFVDKKQAQLHPAAPFRINHDFKEPDGR